MNFVIEDATCKEVNSLKWSGENDSLSPGCRILWMFVMPSDQTYQAFFNTFQEWSSLTQLPYFDGILLKKNDNWWKHDHETGSVLQCLTDTKVCPPWSYNQDQTNRRAKYLLKWIHPQKSRFFTTNQSAKQVKRAPKSLDTITEQTRHNSKAMDHFAGTNHKPDTCALWNLWELAKFSYRSYSCLVAGVLNRL